MELSKLEKYKTKYKEFNSKIDSLEQLLSKYIEKGNISVISLDQVSQKLNVSTSEAYFLLSLAEDENLVDKRYQVRTIDDEFDLGEFENKNEIPSSIYSEAQGKYIDKDKYYIDIVFEFK